MKNIVRIPSVTRDGRIGSVFNHLFSVINQCEELDDEVVWDFGNMLTLHPFFIFPLAIYRSTLKNRVTLSHVNQCPSLLSYLSVIKFDEFLDVNDNKELENVLTRYSGKSYTPICRFDLRYRDIDGMQSVVESLIRRQVSLSGDLRASISYMFAELICNMQEHSDAKSGFLFSQYLKKDNCLYIGLADDGITIYGSYVKTGKYLDVISQAVGSEEAKAISMAKEGFSTKNRPDAENRGYGISSNSKMIVEGLGGSFFLFSGGAFNREEGNQNKCFTLPENIRWDGTIILVKISVKPKQGYNYYQYIR